MIPKTQDPMQAAHNAPRCFHVRMNGLRCGAPALSGRRFCRFHEQSVRPRLLDYTLPFVEDASTAQLALNQILRALQDKHWDLKTCALMLYDLQIACSNLKRLAEDQPIYMEEPPSLTALLMKKLDQMAAELKEDDARAAAPGPDAEPWEKKPSLPAQKG